MNETSRARRPSASLTFANTNCLILLSGGQQVLCFCFIKAATAVEVMTKHETYLRKVNKINAV